MHFLWEILRFLARATVLGQKTGIAGVRHNRMVCKTREFIVSGSVPQFATG